LFNKKLAANLIVTLLLVGALARIAIVTIQSSVNQETSKVVYGQPYVPVPDAIVDASGDNGAGYAIADNNGQYDMTSGLLTGSYSVDASANGYIVQQLNNINVTSGAETTGPASTFT